MKQSQEGSITVFLSLILLLILAIVMTTVEATRVNVAKVYSDRALTTAMDSVLAEYYLPLFTEYHIFALDSGYGTDTIQTESICTKLEDYMEYTFEPNKDLYALEDYIPISNFNIFDIHTRNLEIKQMNTIMDFGGDLFVGQAISYMKYQEIGMGLENFLQKLSIIKDTKVAQTVLSEKQKAEESLYSIDKGILDLMRLIDGISINENGVKTDSAGKILIKGKFVKKICILPVTKENLGIENELVFSSLNTHYVQPLQMIDQASTCIDSILDNIILKNSARISYLFLTLIDQSEIKDEKELEVLQSDIQQAKELLDQYTMRESSLLSSFKSEISDISELIEGTLTTIQSALPIIEDLMLKQNTVTAQIIEYESILLANKQFFSDEFYQGLREDLAAIQKYKKTGTEKDSALDNYDFLGMKDTLLNNKIILLEMQKNLGVTVTAEETSLNVGKESLTRMRSTIGEYSHKDLRFDYNTLTKPVESVNFFQCLNSILKDGIMGLVVEDMDSISDKELTATDLPTFLHQIKVRDEPKDVSEVLSAMDLTSEIGSLADFFSYFGEDLDLADTIFNAGDALGQIFLFQEYLLEYFDCYGVKEGDESISALDYELEYILMGNNADYKNFKAIIMRILLIRTIMNMITLMGDTKGSGQARTMAIGFVGFTGFPALISIMKTIIISIWAFAESLVDVAALLQGKSVPLLNKGGDVKIELYELALINKEFIKRKVASMKENTVVTDLSYQDYLRLFLFTEGKEEKSYRAMDLIQENLQSIYEDTFYIKNCLFGFQIDAEFQMDTKFITLPFVKRFIDYKDNTYVFHSTKEYSY